MKLLYIIATFVSIIFGGCSSLEQVDRGNLSDAIRKASDKNSGSRTTEPAKPAAPEEPANAETDHSVSQKNSVAVNDSSDESEIQSYWFGFEAGNGVLSSNDYFGLTNFSIHLGGYTNKFGWLQYNAGFNYAPVQQTSKLSHSLSDGVFLIGAGVSYRFFTTPEYTFLGHYLIFGGGMEWMFWNYKNTIQSPRTDNWGNIIGYDYISGDNLAGIDLHCGTGINIAQFSFLRLGGEITPGIILWAFKTREGFANDIFSPFLYVKFKFTFTFRVPE